MQLKAGLLLFFMCFQWFSQSGAKELEEKEPTLKSFVKEPDKGVVKIQVCDEQPLPSPPTLTNCLVDLEEPEFDPFANMPTTSSYKPLSLDGLEKESLEDWIRDYERQKDNPFLGKIIFDCVLEKSISVVYNQMCSLFPQISVDARTEEYQFMIKNSLEALCRSSLWLKKEYSLSVAYLTLLYERTIQKNHGFRDENNIVTLGVAYVTLGFPKYAKPLLIYVKKRFDQQKVQKLMRCIQDDMRTGCMQQPDGKFISRFFRK